MIKFNSTTDENFEYTEEEKEKIRKFLLDAKDAMAKDEPVDEETIEQIYIDMCIRQGLRDAKDGKGITTEEFLKEIATWQ